MVAKTGCLMERSRVTLPSDLFPAHWIVPTWLPSFSSGPTSTITRSPESSLRESRPGPPECRYLNLAAPGLVLIHHVQAPGIGLLAFDEERRTRHDKRVRSLPMTMAPRAYIPLRSSPFGLEIRH